MPKLKMTDAVVKRTTAKPGDRIDYFDDRQRGLVLRVSGSTDHDGNVKVTRTWAVMCRVLGNNKIRRFTIGPYPETKLGEARDKAADIIKGARREGTDPLKERRRALVVAELAGRDTIEALVQGFVTYLATRPKKKGGMRSPRYVEEVRRNFNNHLLPRWSGRTIHEITRRDVTDLLNAVADQGTDMRDEHGNKRHVAGGKIAANRMLAAVSGFFSWAVGQGILGSTPANKLEKLGEEVEREHTLSDAEIRIIWPAMKALGYPFGHFFMLALATGQRRDEVAKLEWAEIDEKAKTWTIPKGRTKGRREHVVPLSQLALNIIADAKTAAKALAKARANAAGLDRIPELPRFVFSTRNARIGRDPSTPNPTGAPISGFSRAKSDLDAKVAALLKKAQKKEIEDWRVHDLRRTASTRMGDLGVAPHVIEVVLNHIGGFRAGVAGVYNRADYLGEARDALDKWGEHLSTITKARTVADERAA